MSDLWEKLRAAQSKASAPLENLKPPGAEEEQAPPGWRWVTALVAERTLRFEVDPGFWRVVSEGIDQDSWTKVYCFDTETTGLSGGAGTVAFLVGWASLVPIEFGQQRPAVEIRQWFLRDLPGEADLLEALDAALKDARSLVSFNGASFDLPLLRSRWILAGKKFPEIPHRDDLHPARRLWKRLLGSCRLSRLEETVLGLRRQDDVPGGLVPALWFDYLRQGASPDFVTPLEEVLRHHAQDVYSLLCLDMLLACLAGSPETSRWEETFGAFPVRPAILRPGPAGLLHPDLGRTTPVDFWGLLNLKHPAAREASLRKAWTERKTLSLGLAWADKLKRSRSAEACAVWSTLWEQHRSIAALEELLKWLEHRVRTPESRHQALALIDQALKAPFLPREGRAALEKRRTRLEGKPLPLS